MCPHSSVVNFSVGLLTVFVFSITVQRTGIIAMWRGGKASYYIHTFPRVLPPAHVWSSKSSQISATNQAEEFRVSTPVYRVGDAKNTSVNWYY